MGLFNKKKIEETQVENYDFDIDENFRFVTEDTFQIGKKLVVVGVVLEGSLTVGDRVLLNHRFVATIDSLEQYRKRVTVTTKGEKVGILVDGSKKDLHGNVCSSVEKLI